MDIRLEYSQTEGKFKQAQLIDQIDVAKGYKTLCCYISKVRATRFCKQMLAKHPKLNAKSSQDYPLLTSLKRELYHFIAEEIYELEEKINNPYKRPGAADSQININ